MPALGRHIAAQLIRFTGRVIGGDDGQAHDLFLKQGNSKRFLEHGNQ